jgi:hypothetical protein
VSGREASKAAVTASPIRNTWMAFSGERIRFSAKRNPV